MSHPKVTAYLQKQTQWQKELQHLRSLFQQTELLEEFKWSAPTYTLNGKLVAGMAAFKNHYAIWFHQGVFLKDSQKKLLNAQEGKTKALRQWRFEKGDVIPDAIVLSYLKESIENCLAGKEVKPERKKGVSLPPILKSAFQQDKDLKTAFEQLTPGRQREYAEHIGGAKQEKTQESRLEKAIPLILKGVGLNDKYKNC
ncbi:MAG TPA: YdeI/OmpD-associated family protein [Flavobacteriaceae bacterium]|mgnify:CR=1 FL=1|nr:YdeI/OmpD-associated family protein [Flavobacteriaceae bacterium]MCB9213821.1 YdeI/OmpD-associated family protein [Alteromonas sp.]HPF11217.1 YdeI/OmpD-associated family protein [Flavobacteriaceae bacterium]HQU21696.1 YdeI/OmpD-associated family protein [Flavobacteriaceae bacterium]HQU64564.1 YdeI/OmpD-associated family protein [Flavobacteriaceae bacterium]